MIKKLTERTHFLLFNPKSQQLIYFGWTHKSGNKRGLCVLLSDQNRFLLKIHQLGINPTPPFVTRRRHIAATTLVIGKFLALFKRELQKNPSETFIKVSFIALNPKDLFWVLFWNETKCKRRFRLTDRPATQWNILFRIFRFFALWRYMTLTQIPVKFHPCVLVISPRKLSKTIARSQFVILEKIFDRDE